MGAQYADIGTNANQGAAYVFVKPATGWATTTAAAKLTASDGAAYDEFGTSVAIDGDTVVVGALNATAGQGAAYVFVKPPTGWATTTAAAKLTASDGAAHDNFGTSVAIDGDTVVVGAPGDHIGTNVNQGAAYVFVKPATGWATTTAAAKLTAYNRVENAYFGYSVAISRNTVVVGAPHYIDTSGWAGSAYVFVKPYGGWATMTESAMLGASDGASGYEFGTSVAISGDIVVVGAVSADSSRGAAYVFVEPATGWGNMNQTAKLTASDGASGDYFGYSVAISGHTVYDEFGAPVGISGDTIVVGAPGWSHAAYIFIKPGGGWATTSAYAAKLITVSDGVGRNFGLPVAISGGTTVVIGRPVANINGHADQGAAYVFAKPILTVTKAGTGSGTVTSTSPDGRINCGSTCAASFDAGTTVTLSATADAGSTFAGWSGDCNSSGQVTMNADKTCTATFTPIMYTLTVTLRGSGLGQVTSNPSGITCSTASTCIASYASGTIVTLTTASLYSTFKQWGGACSGTATTCTVTLTANQSVTATFSQLFTDPTLTAGSTPIKAIHVTELRLAISILRAVNGLAAFAWTDPTLTAGTTPVKKVHLDELRTALGQAYQAAGQPAPSYTDPTLTAGSTPIKAVHISELRTAIRALE